MKAKFVKMNSPFQFGAALGVYLLLSNTIFSQVANFDSLTKFQKNPYLCEISHPTNHFQSDSKEAIVIKSVDSIPSKVTYFYEPFPMQKGGSVFQIGGSFSLLPIPIAEQEYPIPALDVQYKYGISTNLSFVASLSTLLYYSDLLHAGIQWNVNSDRLSLGLASHFGLAYGYISDNTQFDEVWAYGFFYMPIIRVGYRFDHFSLTLSFVTTYAFDTGSYINKTRGTLGSEKTLNDFYCTISVEQPFLKNQQVTVGFSFAYSRTPYQSWMLYNTVNEWLFVPEFFFAVQL